MRTLLGPSYSRTGCPHLPLPGHYTDFSPPLPTPSFPPAWGDCLLLASPCRSGPRPTKLSHQFGTCALAATAPGKVLGSGFRHGAPQRRMLKGSAPSSSARHPGPSQDPGARSDPRVHPDRMWTTSTTARTAGSSTCWTSATWRAGESPAVPPALPHATPALIPILAVNSRVGPTHLSAHVRSFYCFTRSKDATSAA